MGNNEDLITGPDLFRAIADQIEKHPESYDQRSWKSICGTSHCIGGWAVALNGYMIDTENHEAWTENHSGYIAEVAAKLLDITVDDAEFMFAHYRKPIYYHTMPETLRIIADDPSAIWEME